MNGTDLVGTWRLVTWQARSVSGDLTDPFGPDAAGYIIYAADGHMSATLMRPGRQNVRRGTMHAATVAEKVAAIDSYIAYAGTYSVQPGKVIHHVKVSLLPNWIGSDQERCIEWAGERLVLSTPVLPSPDGTMATQRLVWERAQPA